MPAVRRRPFTDEIARISIADLRKAVGPAWRDMTSVSLNIGGAVTTIEFCFAASTTTFGCAEKRYLRCRCGAAALTIGLLDGVGIVCRGCSGWKSRDRTTRGTRGPLWVDEDQRPHRLEDVHRAGVTTGADGEH